VENVERKDSWVRSIKKLGSSEALIEIEKSDGDVVFITVPTKPLPSVETKVER